jgi:hypothetical protein
MFSDVIKLHTFIISFGLGMLYVYLVQPKKEVVYRFPNPNNLNKLVYTDKNENCYKYNVQEKNCSELEKDNIKSQPVIEDFKKKK